MPSFAGRIGIIGVNPYLVVPDDVLKELRATSKRATGPIPVRGRLEGHPFQQTVVKYAGTWRLYLNTPMRQATGLQVGDEAHVDLGFDRSPPRHPPPPALMAALRKEPRALAAFEALAPSRQKEISRYLGSMKTKQSLDRNVAKVVAHLCGTPQPEVFLRAATVKGKKGPAAPRKAPPTRRRRVTPSRRLRASRSS